MDETKELTNEFIREQLSDYSDLVAPFDMAPPTVQLMQWKETGGADKLLAQPCSTVIAPQINEVHKYLCNVRTTYKTINPSIITIKLKSILPLQLFVKSIFQLKYSGVCEETEQMRQDGQEGRDLDVYTVREVTFL